MIAMTGPHPSSTVLSQEDVTRARHKLATESMATLVATFWPDASTLFHREVEDRFAEMIEAAVGDCAEELHREVERLLDLDADSTWDQVAHEIAVDPS